MIMKNTIVKLFVFFWFLLPFLFLSLQKEVISSLLSIGLGSFLFSSLLMSVSVCLFCPHHVYSSLIAITTGIWFFLLATFFGNQINFFLSANNLSNNTLFIFSLSNVLISALIPLLLTRIMIKSNLFLFSLTGVYFGVMSFSHKLQFGISDSLFQTGAILVWIATFIPLGILILLHILAKTPKQ